jgi:hypothetical protein
MGREVQEWFDLWSDKLEIGWTINLFVVARRWA